MNWRLSTIAVAAAASLAAAQKDVSTKDLVKIAETYVESYQAKMAYVIADEEYVQRTFDELGAQTRERVMDGELLLTFVPADHEWIAIHDVAAVDGDMVTDRSDLRALIMRGAVESVSRELLARNARFNIGGVERNFNEPTLALLVLEAQRVKGFSFDRKSIENDGGRQIATLAFEEKDTSTLIRDTRGRPVPIKGEIELDAATGLIQRTRIEFKQNGVVGELATIYTRNDKLDMWVPATFTESYTRKTTTDFDHIECNAKYSNYQRFGATARIKK